MDVVVSGGALQGHTKRAVSYLDDNCQLAVHVHEHDHIIELQLRLTFHSLFRPAGPAVTAGVCSAVCSAVSELMMLEPPAVST